MHLAVQLKTTSAYRPMRNSVQTVGNQKIHGDIHAPGSVACIARRQYR